MQRVHLIVADREQQMKHERVNNESYYLRSADEGELTVNLTLYFHARQRKRMDFSFNTYFYGSLFFHLLNLNIC